MDLTMTATPAPPPVASAGRLGTDRLYESVCMPLVAHKEHFTVASADGWSADFQRADEPCVVPYQCLDRLYVELPLHRWRLSDA